MYAHAWDLGVEHHDLEAVLGGIMLRQLLEHDAEAAVCAAVCGVFEGGIHYTAVSLYTDVLEAHAGKLCRCSVVRLCLESKCQQQCQQHKAVSHHPHGYSSVFNGIKITEPCTYALELAREAHDPEMAEEHHRGSDIDASRVVLRHHLQGIEG